LSAQGTASRLSALIALSDSPASRNSTGNVWVKKPNGSPCAKYNAVSKLTLYPRVTRLRSGRLRSRGRRILRESRLAPEVGKWM
jgi:hypothetical protein